MPRSSKASILQCLASEFVLHAAVLAFLVAPGVAQKTTPSENNLPKYDSHTETKTKGIVDEVKVFTFGNKKEITELLMKSGDDTVHVFLCPKTFQDEMGVSFSKGDEITVTGSKAKHQGSDVILGREVVKGNDTLVMRDDKGEPVWSWRASK